MWWRELGEVENECNSHNYSLFAIFLPKLSKLVEIWRSSGKNNFVQFFETRCSAIWVWTYLSELHTVLSCLRRRSVVSKDSILFFLFLIPLSGQNLRSLLLHGNKRDRIETLTQCAERSQFVVDCFFRHSDLIYWGFRSSSISSTANISSSSQLFIAVSQQGRRRFSERESSRLRRRPRVSLRQN